MKTIDINSILASSFQHGYRKWYSETEACQWKLHRNIGFCSWSVCHIWFIKIAGILRTYDWRWNLCRIDASHRFNRCLPRASRGTSSFENFRPIRLLARVAIAVLAAPHPEASDPIEEPRVAIPFLRPRNLDMIDTSCSRRDRICCLRKTKCEHILGPSFQDNDRLWRFVSSKISESFISISSGYLKIFPNGASQSQLCPFARTLPAAFWEFCGFNFLKNRKMLSRRREIKHQAARIHATISMSKDFLIAVSERS